MNDEQPPSADLAGQVESESGRGPAPSEHWEPDSNRTNLSQPSIPPENEWRSQDAPSDADLGPDLGNPPPRRARGSVWGTLREIVETVVLALLIFLAVRAVVQNFRVEGSSMYPTFVNGQYVLVNKAAYARIDTNTLANWLPFVHHSTNPEHFIFGAPQRGDVIVFHPPWPNDPSKDFIKRVVAVPGDMVDVRGGNVYVNGALVSTPYIHQPTEPLNPCWTQITLRQNQYYVMGDNRGNSSDSRAWGPIDASEIVGRTLLVYWPATAWKLAPNHAEHVPVAAAAPAPQTAGMNQDGPARLSAFGCPGFAG